MSENAIITVEPEVRLGSLTVLHPVDMIARASEIATALAKVIKDRKLSRVISGREYVYVDGWSTMGAMIGILSREVPDVTRELENGDYTAAVELIRVSDGAVIGYGSAIVGFDEATWKNRPRYAKRSMAITRATGKAYRLGFSWIISLAGYATTPAEEMDGIEDKTPPPAPGNGKPAVAEKPWTSTVISLETAKTATGSDKKTTYWSLPDDQLKFRLQSLKDTLEKGTLTKDHEVLPLTHDEKTDREYRVAIIQAILDYRQ